MAKLIKSQRTSTWPCLPTADLPPKEVADELLHCYLRTTETVYRILHVPTFKKDYEALWESDVAPDAAFLVQTKLVLAIGATTCDEQFSLRPSAIRWVYEAQTWLSEPKFKSRLGIQSLQTNLLLLLARETADVGGESIWIAAGALLRTAMYMGLHRDPAHLPTKTTFAAEMRRRLWNTTLEVVLQSSLTLGASPLISLEDFDTEPPGNFNDDQLVVGETPVSKPEENYTQVSIAILLRKTYPIRLAVAKFLNNTNSACTYEMALQLDAELRESYKALRRTLQGFSSSAESPSRFETQTVDFFMHRYLSALHIPFFRPALHQTSYAFTRKIVLESSLKIWYSAYPSSSFMASAGQNDFARLIACGSGFYRTVALQAALLIAMELKTQLQEEESLGPVPLRPDLLSVLKDAKVWCLQCIEVGETNVKGYMLMCVFAAHVDGLMQGLGQKEASKLIVKAAEDSWENCLSLLEGIATRGRIGEAADGVQQTSFDTPPDVMEGWDFMVRKNASICRPLLTVQMSDVLFDPQPMSFLFNGENLQGQPLW